MSERFENLLGFWQELKRRKVTRIIPVNAAASFVILELFDIITDPLGLPDWTITFVIILLGIWLIISFILSWLYDITPKGIQKTKHQAMLDISEEYNTNYIHYESKILKMCSLPPIIISL